MWKTQAVVKVSPQDIGHVIYTIRLLNFKFQFLKQMVQRVPTITYCYFSTIFFFFCHIYYTSVDEPWCICLSDYRCNGNIVIVTIDNSVLEWKKKPKKTPLILYTYWDPPSFLKVKLNKVKVNNQDNI